jgi:hypothetical protein
MVEQPTVSVSAETRPGQAKIVYLDQHVWIGLLRGSRDGDPVAMAALSALRSAREDGQIEVPLSTSHYLETWHRKSLRSRHELAALMRDLSGYRTLAPLQKVQRLEVERAIFQRISKGSKLPDPKTRIVGHGACHAFDSPTGRFRFVESLATRDEPEGPATDPPEELSALELTGDRWEWFNLAGSQEILESDGVEVTPEHRLGDDYVERELETRYRLSADPTMRKRLVDLMVMQELMDLLPVINDICQKLQIDPHFMFDDGPSSQRSFINDIPTAAMLSRLRTLRHRNMSHPWSQHDRTDLISLAIAVPYCEIVVTERQWCHLIKAARLDRDFGTVVTASFDELPALLLSTRP